jgi:hypothetical protein
MENTGNVMSIGNALFLVYNQAKLMKLIEQKPLGTEVLANDLIAVYPNPAREQFDITLPRGWHIEKAVLYDISGKAVPLALSQTLLGYRVYSHNALPSLYLLHLHTTQGAFTKRIILE